MCIILSYRWLDWLFLLQYLKVITRLSCSWWKWSVRLALLGINWLILLLLVALTRSKKDYFWLIILSLSLATQILALILKKAWSAQVSLLIQFLLSFDITIDRRARSVMLFNLEIFIWLIYLILRLCIYWLWLFFLGCPAAFPEILDLTQRSLGNNRANLTNVLINVVRF